MIKKSKGHRLESTINAGSMADIAFLLLIFFLVSTQFFQEKALKVKLPPWQGEIVNITTTKAILSIKVNDLGELLVNQEPAKIDQLKLITKTFILNPVSKFGKKKASNDMVISLQHDSKTSYGKYLSIYDEIQKAYFEIHQEQSVLLFKKDWEDLIDLERKEILKKYPVSVSEAEPFITKIK